ncbi:Kelch repeat-containing protein [Reichenbachiella ulvae]|uniref:Galactose oxidase n=1 Tax=Reichenbachiella ulvae TaxID=2980104 RepID=A0ABT3D1E9_9BACT|nr:kelch repeat-containing protein [Reichenbachiella ulvae]MCV9389263.1 galactose oxidase [Reichenbachiella ulvae]
MYKSSLLLLCCCILQIKGFAQQFNTLDCEGQPHVRHEAGAVAVNGKLYLLGGRRIQAVDVFDPKTNVWDSLSKVPQEMHHFQPIVYKNRVYIVGAFTGGYPKESPIPHIWIYDPTTDQWSKGPEIPESRRRGGAACVLIQDELYLIGGIQLGHTSGTVAWVDRLNLETGEWKMLTDAPHRRDHVVAASDGKCIYVLGGRTTDYHEEGRFTAFFDTAQPAVDKLDLKSMKWETMQNPLPVASAGGTAIHANNHIYYTGGESDQKEAHDEVQVLDPKSDQWTIVAKLNQGRHGTSLVCIANSLYIASGSGNRGGGPELSSIESAQLP